MIYCGPSQCHLKRELWGVGQRRGRGEDRQRQQDQSNGAAWGKATPLDRHTCDTHVQGDML